MSTPDPLLEMEVAVERISDLSRGGAEPLLPDERIELIDALATADQAEKLKNSQT